jgi:hypothetical protein
MQRFLIIILMVARTTHAAEHKYHFYQSLPSINFILLPHGINNTGPDGYMDALHQGSLQGTEGGINILIKSLIVTIPTACYLLWNFAHAWYTQGSENASDPKKTYMEKQTQRLIIHTQYMRALADFLKAQALAKIALAQHEKDKSKESQAD